MCQFGSGPVGCGLVQAAKAVARQDRPGANGHAIAAARTGKNQSVPISLRRQLAADRLDHQRSQGNLADAGVAFGTRLEATAEPTGLVASVDHLQHRDRTEAPRWRRATGCQRPRAAPTAVPGGQAGPAGAARSGTRRRPGRHSAARTHPGGTVDVPSDLSGARAGRGQGPAGIRRRCARAEPSSPRRRPQISTMTGSYLAQLSANGPGAGAARRAALRRRWR